MNHIVGSAITISSEIPSDKVSGTSIVLESLVDPDGTELADSQAFTFGTGDDDTNIATYTLQTSSSWLTGKYNFILKATNGSYESFSRGSFILTERPS
jgi:hypothetical protein